MRVLFNGLSLHPPLSGIGWYTHTLAKTLASKGSNVLYWGHTSAGTQQDLEHDLASVDLVKGKRLARLRLIPHLRLKPVLTALSIKRRPRDIIYHETNFIPRMWGLKTVSTIHDLSILHSPELHPKDRVEYMQRHLHLSAERSDHIIAISNSVKSEIVEKLNVPASKVTVTHLAARAQFQPRTFEQVEPTLTKHKLNHRRFLLMMGSFEPRKNLSVVLQAIDTILDSDWNDYTLVHAGPPGWNNEQTTEVVRRLTKSGRLKQLGYLADRDLADLVASARAVVFPSKYEGFGLPIVEAMVSETPVITSNHGAMAEVAGSAASLVGGNEPEELAQKIRQIISDDHLFNQLQAAGKEQAKLYSWAKCTEQTLNVYQSLKN
jgi:glycosyltransferase involved in cell wall biosynthesis